MSTAPRPDPLAPEPFRFPLLAGLMGICHGVTQREGPGLAGNMSFTRGPDPDTVIATRARWCQRVGVDPAGLVVARQVHGTDVEHITVAQRGRGALAAVALPAADILVTNEPNLPLMTISADCVPLLLVDPRRRVVAVAHAGWRGTMAGVATRAVATLVDCYGSRATDLLVGAGPSIGPCCYEVGPEVASAADLQFGQAVLRPGSRPGHPHLDLWEANRLALLAAGLQPANIELAGICTCCDNDRYFSHRAEGPTRGLFATIVALTDR